MLIFLIAPILSFGQDLDTNSISKVFQVEGKNASELFSSINLAVAKFLTLLMMLSSSMIVRAKKWYSRLNVK